MNSNSSSILGQALNQVNNFDMKITNNNYFAALPECLAALLKQATQKIREQSINYNHHNGTVNQRSKSESILGKRRRYKLITH
jgi:hypothetical protein